MHVDFVHDVYEIFSSHLQKNPLMKAGDFNSTLTIF